MRRALFLIVFATGLASCLQATDPPPFQVSMQITRTSAAPGDTIVVLVDSQGPNIINMLVAFDDGDTTAFNVGGARQAQGVFPHAFTTIGNYRIRAKVTNADGNQLQDKFDSVDVHIQ